MAFEVHVLFLSFQLVVSAKQVETQLKFFEDEMDSFESNLTSRYVQILLLF